jgi:hypothetical protein
MDFEFVPESHQPVSPPSTIADIVSPMSQTTGSIYPVLTRSLTTRSDELHM